MIASFSVHLFYPDGGPPESGVQNLDTLSVRWLSVCRNLYESLGPVFAHNMGSTLAHFDIESAGPIGKLIAHRIPCFEFAVTLGTNSAQDIATSDYFRKSLAREVSLAGNTLSEAASATIESSATTPCALLIDRCAREVDDEQKHALIQLGYHLIAAYYQYLAYNCGRSMP